MEPTYKAIADLFAIAPYQESEIQQPDQPKEGRTPEESRELGKKFLSDGDFKTAIKHFQSAVAKRKPEDINALIDLAGAYDYGDEYPYALRQYEKALRVKEDATEPRVGISDLYRRYGRFRDSIHHLEEAVKLEPHNSFLHIKLAEVLRDAGEPKRALASAQLAVISKPDEAFYHYWIGDLLISLKRYAEALDSLRAAIELSPGDDFLYLRAAVAFWGDNRKAEAIKAVRLASDLDPNKDLHHGLLAKLLHECGQEDDAALETNRSSKMDRYDLDCLGRILAEMGIEKTRV